MEYRVENDGFRERDSKEIQGPFLDPSGFQPPAAVKIQDVEYDSPTKSLHGIKEHETLAA